MATSTRPSPHAAAPIALAAALFAGLLQMSCQQVLDIPDRSAAPHLECAQGSCTCAAGYGDCDADLTNGCETDLQSSPTHCGACSHDCLGGGCEQGQCQPLLLASSIDVSAAARLSVDELRVIYCSADGIHRLELGASSSDDPGDHQVATSSDSVLSVVHRDEAIYWSAGSAITSLTGVFYQQAGAKPQQLAIAGDYLFWTQRGSGGVAHSVNKRALLGGDVVELTTLEEPPDLLGASTSTFYFGARVGQQHGLFRASAPATPIVTWTPLQTTMMVVLSAALDEHYVYFNRPTGKAQGTELWRLSHDGEADGATKMVDSDDIRSFTLDGDYLYFTDSNGSVQRVGDDGGSPELIVGSQNNPTAVATNSQAVFWLTTYQGASSTVADLLMVAKPPVGQ